MLVTDRLRADGAHAMTLAYEKTMLPACFVARKMYTYLCHKPGSGTPTHVSMGLLSKKRGTAALIRQAFIDCERAYLLDPTVVTTDQVRDIQLLALRSRGGSEDVAGSVCEDDLPWPQTCIFPPSERQHTFRGRLADCVRV